MNKFLNRLFKRKPATQITVVKYYFTTEEKIKWTKVDSWVLNAFVNSDTGKKLFDILNDSALCKKMEINQDKTPNSIMYSSGIADGLIASILKIKSLSTPPDEEVEDE